MARVARGMVERAGVKVDELLELLVKNSSADRRGRGSRKLQRRHVPAAAPHECLLHAVAAAAIAPHRLNGCFDTPEQVRYSGAGGKTWLT